MAYELPVTQHSVSVTAGADLSALQYTFVKLNSSGQVVAVSAINDVALGVLQNAPTSGKTAEVCVHGVTKLKASAAITLPSAIGFTTSGKSVGVTILQGASYVQATKSVVGQAITAAGANNDIHTVFISAVVPIVSA